MTKITLVEPGGDRRTIDVAVGDSIMEAAVKHSVKGIIGECGGNCACGTCRVYVEPAWQDKLEPPGEAEMGMLSFIDDPKPELRLSCQIKVTSELEGLVVVISDTQY